MKILTFILVLLPTFVLIAFFGFIVGLKTGYEMPRQLLSSTPKETFLSECVNLCVKSQGKECFDTCFKGYSCINAKFL